MDTKKPINILDNPDISRRNGHLDELYAAAAPLAKILISKGNWSGLSEFEKRIYLQHLVSISENEAELRAHLKKAKIEHRFSVDWKDVDENNTRDLEARALFKAMEGFISKNGAMVTLQDFHDFLNDCL